MVPLGSSKPCVSRQQVVLVLALIGDSGAMETEKMLDSRHICRFQTTTNPTKMHAVLTAFPAAGDHLLRSLSASTAPLRKILVQNRLALSERDCKLDPPREIATYSRCSFCEPASSGKRSTARRSLLAPGPVNKICWQSAENHQDTQPEWRNDESDADLPRF